MQLAKRHFDIDTYGIDEYLQWRGYTWFAQVPVDRGTVIVQQVH